MEIRRLTKEETELARLWVAGKLSSTQIGRELGVPQQSVVAKAKALQLPARRVDCSHLDPIGTAGKKAVEAVAKLEDDQCRWPVGQLDDLKFCPGKKGQGRSYCDHHHVRAYPRSAS